MRNNRKTKTLYHVTAEGPKKCEATVRKCKYDNGSDGALTNATYATYEAADVAYKEVQRQKQISTTNRKKYRRWQDGEYHDKLNVSLSNRTSAGRAMARRARSRRERGVPEAEFFEARSLFFHEGTTMIVTRESRFNKYDGKLVPLWKITTKDSNGVELSRYSSNHLIRNHNDVKNLRRSMYSSVTGIVRDSGTTDESEVNYIRSTVMDNFINELNTLETGERGAVNADAIGASYFHGSNRYELHATANFNETAFDVKHVEQALSAEQYRYSVPTINVNLYAKAEGENPSQWVASCVDNKWTLRTVDQKGDSDVVGPSDDFSELRSRIETFNRENIKTGKEESAIAAKDVSEIFVGVLNAQEEHTKRVESNIQRRKDAQAISDQMAHEKALMEAKRRAEEEEQKSTKKESFFSRLMRV